MGLYTQHIENLKKGQVVSFRPHGNSMTPKIKSGQLCTIAPCDPRDLERGDIVLCKVKGMIFVHLVSATKHTEKQIQISNNHGYVNGWTGYGSIYGKLVSVE